MTKSDRIFKRTFDICCSALGLMVSLPIIIMSMVVAWIDTGKSGFFMQSRVGLNGKIFSVVKIRTMRVSENLTMPTVTITTALDSRVTTIGHFFRKTKIDELPQLWNVLVGDMSFVGPRPDVPGYADMLNGEDRIILTIRPGITGPATLKYKNEEKLLAKQSAPILFNDKVIWPDKVKINREYVENYRFLQDFVYIWKTIVG